MKLSDFQIDPDKASAGVWCDFVQDKVVGDKPHDENICALIAPAGNPKYRALARSRGFKSAGRRRRRGDDIAWDELHAHATARAVFLDLANVDEFPQPTAEQREEILTDPKYQPFADWIEAMAADLAQDLAEAKDAALGN